jgi:pimeloyl-ACP methyl ester carboxylesterase
MMPVDDGVPVFTAVVFGAYLVMHKSATSWKRINTFHHWGAALGLVLGCVATLAAQTNVLDHRSEHSQSSLTPRNMKTNARQAKMEEVRIPLKDGHSFKGALTLPESKAPVAAVIVIPGFVPGAKNESEEAWRGGSAEHSGTTLTRYLTEIGLAVLHIPINSDGAATGPASLDELADRAQSGIRYLKERREIDPARIGIIGQSIGGFVAAKAAARSKDIAFMVTLATPVDSIDRTFDEVLDRLLRRGGAAEKERQAIRKKMQQVFAAAAQGASADTLRPAVDDFLRAEYAWFPKQQRQLAGKDADEFVRRMLDDHVRDLTTPLYRTMIGYDVGQDLIKVDRPMLVLFAENDFKVEPQRASKIALALLQKTGRTNWKIEVVAGADHFFERSDLSSSSATLAPENRFPIAFLTILKSWLVEHGVCLHR